MLLSEDTRNFILAHCDDNVYALAFQARHYPKVDIQIALTQIEGRQKVKDKLPLWYANHDIHYPQHLYIEQCSSELTAKYKATLVEGKNLIDLTGGMGVDCFFMSQLFDQVTYIEQRPDLCELAEHNFQALGLSNVKVVCGNSVEYLQSMATVDTIFIDPARRDKNGGKVFAISDCEPDLLKIRNLLLKKADNILIKLSPMLDLSAAISQLKDVSEVHIVSIANECKELLLVLNKKERINIPIYCINLGVKKQGTQSFEFSKEEEAAADCIYASSVGKYLYEPNVSLLKAGAFRTPAVRFKIQKISPNSHLYTSDTFINNFPGRLFQVDGYSRFNKKDLHNLLRGMKKANIIVRNFPMSAVDLHKRFRLSDGGEDFLIATQLSDGQHVIIHSKKVTVF